MAFLNEQTGELHLKVLLSGGSGCGKTTFLKSLYHQSSGDFYGNSGNSESAVENSKSTSKRSFVYEFLPISLGEFQTKAVRLNLYTLSSHDLMPYLDRCLLTGVDGVIHILDSRLVMQLENERALKKIKSLSAEIGIDIDQIPQFYVFNFRDGRDIIPFDVLSKNYSHGSEFCIESIATSNVGVLESVEHLCEQMIFKIDQNLSFDPPSMPQTQIWS